MQYEYNYYSAPFRLAGSTLWLKATDAMVTLYREHEAVAAHVRATGRGLRRTVIDHMPPAAQAWQLQDTQWCLAQAEQVGPACHALVHALFGDAVLIRLRAEQPVLRRRQFLHGSRLRAIGAKDIAWLRPGGGEMTAADWHDESLRALGCVLHGNAIEEPGPHGEKIAGDTLALLLNAGRAAIEFDLSRHADHAPASWETRSGRPSGGPGGRGRAWAPCPSGP